MNAHELLRSDRSIPLRSIQRETTDWLRERVEKMLGDFLWLRKLRTIDEHTSWPIGESLSLSLSCSALSAMAYIHNMYANVVD